MEYWTHNTHYYPWVLRQLAEAKRVLDVGCGDGLLVQMLAKRCESVLGLEPHLPSAEAAKRRLAETRNAQIAPVTFEEISTAPESYDAIVFVASLHHMDQDAALIKAKSLLAPGGRLIVVGCAFPDTPLDWTLEALRVIPAKLGSALHGEKNGGNIGVPTQKPTLSTSGVRELVRKLLPGAKLRQGLYYRYLLTWERSIRF